MLLIRIVVWLMDLSMVIGLPQFNLHYTDVVCESSSKIFMEHNCLYARTRATTYNGGSHQILVFCLSECPSKWKIDNNNHHQKLTFAELRIQNITSQELYLWSAPIYQNNSFVYLLKKLMMELLIVLVELMNDKNVEIWNIQLECILFTVRTME